MNIEAVKRLIRDVPDFPEPGVVFKDITPLLADPAAFEHTIELLADRLAASEAEEILAIESRGFIFGAAVAARLSLPLHLVRKPGKLPLATVGIDYALEYATDRVEIHRDVLRPGIRFAIVDDPLEQRLDTVQTHDDLFDFAVGGGTDEVSADRSRQG